MRIKRSSDHTYLTVLDDVYYNDEQISIDFINNLIEHFYQVTHAMPFTAPVFFILDYTTRSYVSITNAVKEVVQYDPRAFLEGGIGFLIDIYQPEDFMVYNESIFKKNTEFLQSVPPAEHGNYVFSYNFRARNAKREWVPLQQKSTYITSQKTGLPLYNIGVVLDISDYKHDTIMMHQIEKYEMGTNGSISKQLITRNYFYPYKEDQLLTSREKEILLRMTDGMSSKEIADKLFISENTVNVHRKSMLKKTNTKNVAHLIAYAIKSKII